MSNAAKAFEMRVDHGAKSLLAAVSNINKLLVPKGLILNIHLRSENGIHAAFEMHEDDGEFATLVAEIQGAIASQISEL